ncbi:NitT/TauT family transport system permease protein [Roseibium hamelinense]|uniref:NitT/TauT family transport system permease protein n=1 Tax=Roseibium hamelinense TaxID=150831 RepID=A0A562THW8_9HYPH|nr:ABC transporter permease [Roseibium hamelinense]MTI45855.1 ABC transporter permease [Roseibium hamelinense]TWI92963.1 NitT/TauT family transport system permease protein [Roseibium hamelinense]
MNTALKPPNWINSSSLLSAGIVICALAALVTPAFDTGASLFADLPLTLVLLLLAALALVFVLKAAPGAGFLNGPARGTALLDAALGLAILCAAGLLIPLAHQNVGEATGGFWAVVVALWLSAWLFVERIASLQMKDPSLARAVNFAIPVAFGATLLLLWELIVTGAGVPKVLLPAPSEIWLRMTNSVPILWADFQQTFLKAVLIGYALGCGSAFITAIAIDRVPFLRRGLLPVGNLVSALPIIGVAPIMVMWFGFDWPSKAAVVIIMTFFPMLVNTVSGLAASEAMQRDLMRTYASNYWQTLIKLRLPMAMPFIFNALKINSTLALIGAIVAEFFGTPIVGMGFRISTEVGRMNVDMVWAEIAVAALAGSLFYGAIALLERAVTFWHPSIRG